MKFERNKAKDRDRKLTRRTFMTSSAASAAFTIASRSVLGGHARPAPSERINLAFIGTGDMGMGDLNDLMNLEDVEVVAVCDVAKIVDYRKQEFGGIAGLEYALETVEQRNVERTKSGSYTGCTGYEDFREMLDKEEGIDAVVVATPDHGHAAACLAAIGKGKHVYCEKPLAHSIYEVRVVTEAANKAGVATQMGNHGHSEEGIRPDAGVDTRRRDRAGARGPRLEQLGRAFMAGNGPETGGDRADTGDSTEDTELDDAITAVGPSPQRRSLLGACTPKMMRDRTTGVTVGRDTSKRLRDHNDSGIGVRIADGSINSMVVS